MEISAVRRRVQGAIVTAQARGQERRQRVTEATQDYGVFLETVAKPVMQQIANVLKVEGYPFTMSTPGDTVQLSYDRGRDDFIEFALDTSNEHPEVVGRISRSRGSRRIDEERPLKAGAGPAALTEEDILEFVVQALGPWLGR